jgi:hypothetical protein
MSDEFTARQREGADSRLGYCYRLAGLYVQTHDGTRLVHGSIEGMGHPRNPHAWAINVDGSIHDGVLDDDWPADAYERFFSAVPDAIFTRDEVFEHCRSEGHWGPWERIANRNSL